MLLRPFKAMLAHPTFFSVSRRSIAGAAWAGLFIALLPLPGQTVIAALVALVLRVNLPIAVLSVWLTNPLTMLPIFYWEYRLGSLILELPLKPFSIELSWAWLAAELQDMWRPLLLGAFITATVVASTAYVLINLTWRLVVTARYRRRRALAARQ